MEKSGQKSSRPISLDAQDYQPRTGTHDLFISPTMYSQDGTIDTTASQGSMLILHELGHAGNH